MKLDNSWGLDHGTWSVLRQVYPAADIPVVQLSIDETKPASFHFEIGKKLASLRDEGVLIVGSGNLVHNLHTYAWGRHPSDPYDWAVRFERAARDMMLAGEYKPLSITTRWDATRHCPPRPPTTICRSCMSSPPDRARSTSNSRWEGVDGGSISMLSVQIG